MLINIILIITLGAVIICCAIWLFGVYYDAKLYCDRCISFERFLTIYENAPEKVDLCQGYFSYEYWDEDCTILSKRINFYFTIPDTIRYERWRKEMKREKEKEKADAVMKKIEELWYEDAVNVSLKNIEEKQMSTKLGK